MIRCMFPSAQFLTNINKGSNHDKTVLFSLDVDKVVDEWLTRLDRYYWRIAVTIKQYGNWKPAKSLLSNVDGVI